MADEPQVFVHLQVLLPRSGSSPDPDDPLGWTWGAPHSGACLSLDGEQRHEGRHPDDPPVVDTDELRSDLIEAINEIVSLGLTVTTNSDIIADADAADLPRGLSVYGTAEAVESALGVAPQVLTARVTDPLAPFSQAHTVTWTGRAEPGLDDPTGLGLTWSFPNPALPADVYGPAPTGTGGRTLASIAYDLQIPQDVTGSGVRVAVVDTGLVHRVVEVVPVQVTGRAELSHPWWGDPDPFVVAWPAGETRDPGNVIAVRWDATDRRSIWLQPADDQKLPRRVWVVYTCLHPHFSGAPDDCCNVPQLRCSVHAIPKVEPTGDGDGHGTQVAACVHAVAPDSEILSVKYTDGSRINDPVSAFEEAVRLDPDVIVCSWVMYRRDQRLRDEIRRAVRKGIVVVIAAGNGHADRTGTCPQVVAHPDAILVGGSEPAVTEFNFPAFDEAETYRVVTVSELDSLFAGGQDSKPQAPQFKQAPAQGGGIPEPGEVPETEMTFESVAIQTETPELFEVKIGASPLASGFTSQRYAFYRRHVPDVVGLMGPLVVPVEPFSASDRRPDTPLSRNVVQGDGWVTSDGTSLAAPQVAGLVALILEKYRHLDLKPLGVKNILMNTSREVNRGVNAQGAAAQAGWDEASGWGQVSGTGALGWLVPDAFVPFVRTAMADTGDPSPSGVWWRSPDILLVPNGPAHYGINTKHISDLGAFGGDDAMLSRTHPPLVGVRIQNRGEQTGDVYVSVYVVWGDEALCDPTLWQHLRTIQARDLRPGTFRPTGVEELDVGDVEHLPADTMSLIAVLHTDETPPIEFTDDGTGLGFRAWVGANPNVAWRWCRVELS